MTCFNQWDVSKGFKCAGKGLVASYTAVFCCDDHAPGSCFPSTWAPQWRTPSFPLDSGLSKRVSCFQVEYTLSNQLKCKCNVVLHCLALERLFHSFTHSFIPCHLPVFLCLFLPHYSSLFPLLLFSSFFPFLLPLSFLISLLFLTYSLPLRLCHYQFSDTNSASFYSIPFWHKLPGASIRLHKFKGSIPENRRHFRCHSQVPGVPTTHTSAHLATNSGLLMTPSIIH